MLSMIVAMTEDGGIGNQGDLPWAKIPKHITKPDMDYFRATTMGGICIMGRKTAESILRDRTDDKPLLSGRDSWVLSALGGYTRASEQVFGTTDEIESRIKADPQKNHFIIGGAVMYSHFLPQIDRLHVNVIGYAGPCDTYFPIKLEEVAEHGFSMARYQQLSDHVINYVFQRDVYNLEATE